MNDQELTCSGCTKGLTKNLVCDGSHHRTKDEQANKTYVYDNEKRVEVK